MSVFRRSCTYPPPLRRHLPDGPRTKVFWTNWLVRGILGVADAAPRQPSEEPVRSPSQEVQAPAERKKLELTKRSEPVTTDLPGPSQEG